jgi:hypothetical protein
MPFSELENDTLNQTESNGSEPRSSRRVSSPASLKTPVVLLTYIVKSDKSSVGDRGKTYAATPGVCDLHMIYTEDIIHNYTHAIF